MQYDNRDSASVIFNDERDIQDEIKRLIEVNKEYCGELCIKSVQGWDLRYIGIYPLNDLFDALYGKIIRITIVDD